MASERLSDRKFKAADGAGVSLGLRRRRRLTVLEFTTGGLLVLVVAGSVAAEGLEGRELPAARLAGEHSGRVGADSRVEPGL